MNIPRPPRPAHAVVVGGGISGLTAAYRLSQSGTEVVVIEPGPIGGKLQTSVFAGRAVDEAADAFLLRVPWALALCHDLELDGELISPVARRAEVLVDGIRRPLPAGHVMGVPTDLDSLAASGLVSAAGVARAAEDLELAGSLDDPGSSGTDVSIGAFLRRRLGDEVVDRLIDPLIGGINAGDTAALSLATVVPQLDAAARSGDPSIIRACRAQLERAAASGLPAWAPIFATPIGGMARLIDGLVAFMPGVDIRHGRRATAVEVVTRRSSGGSDGARVTLDDGTVLESDAVVLAVPAHVAAPLLRSVSPTAAEPLAAIDHSSIAMVTLAFDRADLGSTERSPMTDDTSGCLIPRDQGLLVTALSNATNKWAQLRDPDTDDVILRVSVGRSGDVRHQDLDDADLTAAVLTDVDRIIGVTGAPNEVRTGRWDRAFPQYAPGHLDRIDQVERSLAATPVRLAGMALRGVGIPACIHSAEQAAASLGAKWPTRRSLLA